MPMGFSLKFDAFRYMVMKASPSMFSVLFTQSIPTARTLILGVELTLPTAASLLSDVGK